MQPCVLNCQPEQVQGQLTPPSSDEGIQHFTTILTLLTAQCKK